MIKAIVKLIQNLDLLEREMFLIHRHPLKKPVDYSIINLQPELLKELRIQLVGFTQFKIKK